ncbi:M56 family metallopeptidase [Hymenobacter sp. BT523]|uniref:M56 family metallopeptidase n=1 Tax=Hymenobacter sp. BT523 TaxID=2795725 RepID=UPI0018EAC4C9|nr:M56 family metallopeptidase [Hymenobacter sp. BT523]MBJ6107482.1 M56 family metallopeptidase [Hymenobacter sp. BT523]
MNPISLLKWMLLSTVLLGVWWLCYRVALRQERSFAYNRWFLVLGPVLAAGLPLLPAAWFGSWGAGPAGLPGVASVLLPAVAISAEGPAVSAGTPLLAGLVGLYAVGVLVALARLGLGLGRLWRSTRRLAREKRDGYTLVPTHGQVPTSSFGRTVFWDDTLALSAGEASQVLRHELAHVRQGHTYDRLLLELLRAGLWFNPFVHWCGKALALTHEFLADEEALRHAAASVPAFSPAQSYAHLLARQVATRLGFSVPLAHTFSHSQTLRRIAMIQKTSPIRRWKQWLALPLLGVLVVAVACEKATNQATPTTAAPLNLEMKAPIHIGKVAIAPPPGNVYTYVEQMPQLPGGGDAQAIVQHIQSHITYSKELAANPKDGVVFATFTVRATGEVQDGAIVKSLTPAHDAAVLAAIHTLPRFTPGKHDGKAVAVSFTVPVRFVAKTPAKSVGLQLFNWYGGWDPKPANAGC